MPWLCSQGCKSISADILQVLQALKNSIRLEELDLGWVNCAGTEVCVRVPVGLVHVRDGHVMLRLSWWHTYFSCVHGCVWWTTIERRLMCIAFQTRCDSAGQRKQTSLLTALPTSINPLFPRPLLEVHAHQWWLCGQSNSMNAL